MKRVRVSTFIPRQRLIPESIYRHHTRKYSNFSCLQINWWRLCAEIQKACCSSWTSYCLIKQLTQSDAVKYRPRGYACWKRPRCWLNILLHNNAILQKINLTKMWLSILFEYLTVYIAMFYLGSFRLSSLWAPQMTFIREDDAVGAEVQG